MTTREQRSLTRQIELADADIEAFTLRLEKFLATNLRQILKGLQRDNVTAQQAAQALGGLFSSLEDLGLNKEILGLKDIYYRQLKQIADNLKESTGKPKILNEVDIEVTEQLIRFDATVIANQVRTVTSDLSSTLMRQVITGETPNVDKMLADMEPRIVANVKTELRTATSAFSRSVNQRKADELGLEYFLYTGPIDKVTREFCRPKVGKVFTRDEIAKWNNGTDLPASIYLGGYNCRHDLRPITKERAAQLGRK